MRGQRNLFDDIIEIPEKPSYNPRGGRNKELMEKRDECLLHRYVFLVLIKRMQYPRALAELRTEFFYSEIIIQRILQKNYDRLLAMKAKRPTPSEFKKRFPWLNWN